MDAAPHSPEGTASPTSGPFLFSIAGAEPLDLYPVLRNGANLRVLEGHLPSRLYAKDYRGNQKPTADYYRLYRFLKRLEKDGLLASEKGVQFLGMGDRPSVWWRPTPKGVQTAANPLPCLGQVQNSNRFAHGGESAGIGDMRKITVPKWLRWPSRCSPYRIRAIKSLNTIRTQENHYMFVRPDPEHLHPDLVAALEPVTDAYSDYLDHINEQEIIVYDQDNPDNFLLFPYRTRFNDDGRARRNLDGYDAKFDEAEKYYDNAVFLTLTTDPAMHSTLWHANRHMSVAWNRFMSLVQKRERIARKDELTEARRRELKKAGWKAPQINQHVRSRQFRRWLNGQTAGSSYRPRNIAVAEFQQNGLIHLHVLIFGKQWLSHKSQLAADWQRCGQGRIVDICAVRRSDQGWTWANPKQRPRDAKPGEDARSYLRKYLNKAIFDKKGFELYFACNRRFFTASRTMEPRKQARPTKDTQSWPDESGLDYVPDGPAPPNYDYQPDPDRPRWRFGGSVPSSEVPNQLRFIAQRCRSKYCPDPPRGITFGEPPPVPAPWEVVAADELEFGRRQREDPRLTFVPASTLITPRANFADFM
jgi:hypothetical protein